MQYAEMEAGLVATIASDFDGYMQGSHFRLTYILICCSIC